VELERVHADLKTTASLIKSPTRHLPSSNKSEPLQLTIGKHSNKHKDTSSSVKQSSAPKLVEYPLTDDSFSCDSLQHSAIDESTSAAVACKQNVSTCCERSVASISIQCGLSEEEKSLIEASIASVPLHPHGSVSDLVINKLMVAKRSWNCRRIRRCLACEAKDSKSAICM